MSLAGRQAAVREAALATTRDARLGPMRAEITALVCDGCGENAVAVSLAELELLTAGWLIADELGGDDFCARCRGSAS